MAEKKLQQQAFNGAGEQVADHPFLQEVARGELPYEKWRDYVMRRLSAGDDFVGFLEAIKETARVEGQTEIADAVAQNINDELGIIGGTEYPEQRHDEWRNWCRSGVQRILEQRGIAPLNEEELPDTSIYPQTLAEVASTKDSILMGGALAALEKIIACEYQKVVQGMEIQLPELTRDEQMYWRGHAQHDHAHFDEIFEPLCRACKTPEYVERALRGLRIILEAKMKFLDAVHGV